MSFSRNLLDKFLFVISWDFLCKLIFGLGDAISPTGIPRIHLRVKNGRYRCIFGQIPQWATEQITSGLKQAEVSSAVIKQMKDGSFRFSRSVPQKLRQRIRNIIVSG
jgi:hypothetical protein|tara:strand:+ start:102 stop:422 length:321 start_codon:yes stop_codon:yes gene_type:complete